MLWFMNIAKKIREEKGNETQTLILLELGFVSHLSFALDFYLCMFRPSSKCLGDLLSEVIFVSIVAIY